MDERAPKSQMKSLVERMDLVEVINARNDLSWDKKEALIAAIDLYRQNGLSEAYIRSVLSDVERQINDEHSLEGDHSLFEARVLEKIRKNIARIVKSGEVDLSKKENLDPPFMHKPN